ncbi:Crp/Fnr family transcriptional regulator [Halomonas shantousis]
MIDALIYRLGNYLALSRSDEQILRDSVVRVEEYSRNQQVNSANERPEYVHIVVEGWLYRYKYLEQGKRSILGYLIPGDVSDIHIALLDHMDHSVSTLTPARCALIPREKISHIFENHTSLAYALFWTSLVEESVLREWFVNNTGRPADKRLAHLLCEMYVRHRASGLVHEHAMLFPLTQNDLADAMGITLVHTNRVLQRLRKEGLITLENKHLVINDWERLRAFAEFSTDYLHLEEQKIMQPLKP